jgi:GH18 family chitinase
VFKLKNAIPVIFGILILTSSGGLSFSPFTVQPVDAELTKRIVMYFPWWQPGHVNQIDYSKVTDINYFSVYPTSNGNLVTENVKTNDLNAIVGNAHTATPRVNVLISVGGWGYSDDFPAMAASDSARTNFVNNIVQFVNDNGLDLINL